MTDDEIGPPAWFTKEQAEALGYPGVPATFDEELNTTPDEALPGEDMPPAGQGPSRGYRERWRAIARMTALGFSNGQIGRRLGYSPAGVSLAQKQPWVQEQVRQFRASYDADITSRMKDIAAGAVDVVEEIINDEKEKSTVRLDAAKWSIEKVTGKAKQEVSHESGTFMHFLEIAKQMSQQLTPDAPQSREVRELAPAQGDDAEQKSESEAWLDANPL